MLPKWMEELRYSQIRVSCSTYLMKFCWVTLPRFGNISPHTIIFDTFFQKYFIQKKVYSLKGFSILLPDEGVILHVLDEVLRGPIL